MAIEYAEPTKARTPWVKQALITEMTWAQLYTKPMRNDLVAISTAIDKNQPTSARPEMKKTAGNHASNCGTRIAPWANSATRFAKDPCWTKIDQF
jgi:hypothetical protein